MSDSEDEGAFASADEGDAAANNATDKATTKSGGKTKANENVKTAGDTKPKDDSSKKTEPKTGRGQQNKKKGKGNQAQANAGGSKSAEKQTQPITKGNKKKDDTTRVTNTENKGKIGDSEAVAQKAEGKGADEKKPEKVVKEKVKQQSPPKDQVSVKAKESISEHKTSDPKTEAAQKDTGDETKQAGEVRRDLQKKSEIKVPESQNIPAEQRDHHTAQQEKVLHQLEETASQNSGGSWGWGWGKSLLSTATNSVQTFTSQVGEGFNTLIETVESGLGVPDPESLAKADDATEPDSKESEAVTHEPETTKSEKVKENLTETQKETEADVNTKSVQETSGEQPEKSSGESEGGGGGNSWFASWGVADLAKKVQSTGKNLAAKGSNLMTEGFDAMENLAAGGIDVLESIGKKTYNTLSEHDPALRKTREYLTPKTNRPNLSSVLREAKDKAEEDAVAEKEKDEARKAHFGTLFDDYQGIAHLEALEMLSNQSEKKVHSLLNSLSSEDLAEIKPKLISIKGAFELDEDNESGEGDSDFSSLVSQCVSELELGTAPDKLNKVHQMVKQWIEDFDSTETQGADSIKEVHEKSIQALADLTSKGVEQFHKAGELVLLEKDDKDCTERAHSLARLTGVLCHEIGNLSGKFVQCLNKLAGDEKSEVTPMVTNVYLEASNSSTYIQDAFLLLLPVLQHAALQHAILSRQSSS